MTTNYLQTSPYLPRQRNFPSKPEELPVVLDNMYIEIAQRVNERTIGVFGTNYAIITGETWYLNGQPRKRQTLRQVYQFGAIAPGVNITIPIVLTGYAMTTKIYGIAITAFPDERPIPYASTAPNDNIAVRVDRVLNQINVANGTAAPAIISGFIVVEFLSNVDTNS